MVIIQKQCHLTDTNNIIFYFVSNWTQDLHELFLYYDKPSLFQRVSFSCGEVYNFVSEKMSNSVKHGSVLTKGLRQNNESRGTQNPRNSIFNYVLLRGPNVISEDALVEPLRPLLFLNTNR